MTYVELFDKTSIENICAILTDIPQRVIFVGDNKKKISRWIQYYQKVFSKRGHNIEFECRVVSKWDVDQVVYVLTEIVNTYDNCVFGVTGGDEMALLALGIEYKISKNPKELENVDRVIFPGVGEAAFAMEQLQKSGFDRGKYS